MTKLQEIRALQKQLPCLDEEITAMQEAVADEQYTAHHAVDVWASCTIGDYQVLRKYDVEIEVNTDWENDLLEQLPKKERQKFLNKNGDLLDEFYETYLPEDYYYSFENGEYVQIWYNVKDHSVYTLGRMHKNPNYRNFNAPWTDLTNRLSERKRTFLNRFGSTNPYLGF